MGNISNCDTIWSNCVNIGRSSDTEPKQGTALDRSKKQFLDSRQNCNSWGRLRQSLLQSSQLRKNCKIDLILAIQRDNDRPLCVFAADQWNYIFKHDAKPAHQPSLFKQTIFWWITARLGKLKTGSGTKACGPNCNPRGLNWNPLGPNYNPWRPTKTSILAKRKQWLAN